MGKPCIHCEEEWSDTTPCTVCAKDKSLIFGLARRWENAKAINAEYDAANGNKKGSVLVATMLLVFCFPLAILYALSHDLSL
jgi:hypothetical protein